MVFQAGFKEQVDLLDELKDLIKFLCAAPCPVAFASDSLIAPRCGRS